MAPRKVLMVTNSELGQANVFMATTHELLERDPNVEVHFVSFAPLEGTMHKILAPPSGSKRTVKFHRLSGRPMLQCLNDDQDVANRLFHVSSLKPGWRHSPMAMRFVVRKIFMSWTAEEFSTIFEEICSLIRSLEPDVVLVDPLMVPGLTAGKHMKSRLPKHFTLAVLSPLSLKDFVHHFEPWGAVLWKWPVIGSGIPMPAPWSKIPLNIFLLFYFIFVLITDKITRTKVSRIRHLTKCPELEIVTNASLVHSGLDGFDKMLVASRPEVDFPDLDLISPPKKFMDKIAACGPIHLPLTTVDDDLAAWLKLGPVIYINFGTHLLTSDTEAFDMALSLKAVMNKASSPESNIQNLQILWKLKKDLSQSGDFNIGPGSAFYSVLGDEVKEGRVRIVDWLSSEPSCILNSRNVICSINHGGANSFYEAVSAGVPQVVLPSWLDCYDFANRAERLGIGRWGSKEGCPRWKFPELAYALIDVSVENNSLYTARCRMIADACNKNGGGRVIAAEELLELLN